MRFQPPTLEQIVLELETILNKKNLHWGAREIEEQAERFFNHFESVGWVIGRTNQKMKSLSGSLGTWIANKEKWDKDKPQGQNGQKLTKDEKALIWLQEQNLYNQNHQ